MTYIELDGPLQDGFGVDNIEVVWSSSTDSDGDGFTEVDGDCDDENPAIHPDAIEDLNNGIDDDCDGAIDGGAVEVFDDVVLWEQAAGIDVELLDFEAFSLYTFPTDEAELLGITLDGALQVVAEIDGASVNDTVALALAHQPRSHFWRFSLRFHLSPLMSQQTFKSWLG